MIIGTGLLAGPQLAKSINTLNGVINVKDFGAVEDGIADDTAAITSAMTAAIAADTSLYFSANATVRVPSMCPTMADAVLRCRTTKANVQITVLLEAGHNITRGVRMDGGDYGHIRITSEDAVVKLDSTFVGVTNTDLLATLARSSNLFVGNNARLPVLDCLIDLEGHDGYGIYALFCTTKVEAGAGVINSGLRNFSAQGGTVYAGGTIWNGAGSEGVRLQQACTATFQAAQVNNCCHNVNPSAASSAVFVSRGSTMHFQDGQAKDSGASALITHRARIVAVNANITNSQNAGFVGYGGQIMFRQGTAAGCNTGFRVISQGFLDASSANLQTTTWSVSLGFGGNIVNLHTASGTSGGGSAILGDIIADDGTPVLNFPFRNGLIFANVTAPVTQASDRLNLDTDLEVRRLGTSSQSVRVTCDGAANFIRGSSPNTARKRLHYIAQHNNTGSAGGGVGHRFSVGPEGATSVVMDLNATGRLAVGGEYSDNTAALHVISTTAGFLPPKLTEAQRDDIASASAGLVLYNTTTNKLQVRTNAQWEDLH